MEQYVGYHKGFKIQTQLDKLWLVRVQPMRPDLPVLRFATFRLPSNAPLFEGIDNVMRVSTPS